MLADFFVHQWLRQRRRVLLIVTEFAVADDIDHDVFFKFDAIVHRNLRSKNHCFRIIAIHVQYRCFDHLDNVGAVQGRT